MSKYVTIDGADYKVVERLGYNPDIGGTVIRVETLIGEVKTAVGSRGLYRFWTARDRVQALTSAGWSANG